MKLFTGFNRIANIAPWMKVVNHDGIDGVWLDHGDKQKLFVNKNNFRVHLPRSLRGKAVVDLKSEDFNAIPKEDSGDTHYKLWREDFDRKRDVEKIWDKYQFTAQGMILLDRFKKYLIKCKMDDVSQLGLDPKFSINMNIFDKMLATPHQDKVRNMLRSVAKKYRMIITLLEEQGQSKLAKRYDKDFYFHWDKLAGLADFDPASYKPKAEAKDREDDEEDQIEDNVVLKAKDQFLQDVEPLLDPQMSGLMTSIEALSKAVDAGDMVQAETNLEHISTMLMGYVGRLGHHPMGQKAEQILHLPSLILLHDKIVG